MTVIIIYWLIAPSTNFRPDCTKGSLVKLGYPISIIMLEVKFRLRTEAANRSVHLGLIKLSFMQACLILRIVLHERIHFKIMLKSTINVRPIAIAMFWYRMVYNIIFLQYSYTGLSNHSLLIALNG